jgi:hypothetical protein
MEEREKQRSLAVSERFCARPAFGNMERQTARLRTNRARIQNEDVTESIRLDEMLRRKFCAIGLNGACSQRLPSHNNNESR